MRKAGIDRALHHDCVSKIRKWLEGWKGEDDVACAVFGLLIASHASLSFVMCRNVQRLLEILSILFKDVALHIVCSSQHLGRAFSFCQIDSGYSSSS